MNNPVFVSRKRLLSEIQWVSRFVAKDSIIPALRGVLIESVNGRLRIVGSDDRTTAVSDVQGVDGGKVSVVVSASSLIKYLKVAASPSVQLLNDESGGLVVLHDDGNSEIRLDRVADAYPELPVASGLLGVSSEFVSAVSKVMSAASLDDSRFAVRACLLDVSASGDSVLVGTDGKRMAVASLNIAAATMNSKTLIDCSLLSELIRIGRSSEVVVSTSDSHVQFGVGGRRLISKKSTSWFPEYRRVVSSVYAHSVTVDVDRWLNAIKGVAVLADDSNRTVQFHIEHGVLSFAAEQVSCGRAVGRVRLPSNGVTFKSAFNAQYLIDGMLAFGKNDDVSFRFSDGASVSELSTDSFRYLVMPTPV